MHKVFVVGAAGKIGLSLARQLGERGHETMALYRKPEQADQLKAIGATPVLGSLLDLDASRMAELMSGSDVVVFTAGAGGKGGNEMTDAIDGRGLELSVAAAKKAGVKRFLLVSAFPEAFRGKHVSDTFENYMAVKKLADVHLAETDMDWVILRPGTLLSEAGNGMVRAGLAIPNGNVRRDDVASALVEIIERPTVNRVIIELTQGDTPVGDAIQRMARS